MQFKCSYIWEDGSKDVWFGNIDKIIKHEGYCEIKISSRSSIYLIFGKYEYGLFAVAPDCGGTYLSQQLDDVFYNSERLSKVFNNVVDGITAAVALATLAKQIEF